LEVGADEIEARRSRWKAPELKAKRGTLYKYIQSVSPASLGCVTDGER
jgi:dihydroxy-acid dehydratase